ncbi:MAG: ATP cone domain-containing protein [Patescibacteria group bacterium UBA2163]
MLIVKGDGTKEPFDILKLKHSLNRSGAEPEIAARVAEKIASTIRDGMTTTEIYKRAYKLLGKTEGALAARYSMRRAIFDLGPTGYPFEDFFSELMKRQGYTTHVRQIMQGLCSEHEVDVVLKKGGLTSGVELKFHNSIGFKTDLKTALYVRARFTDIEDGARKRNEECGINEGWLVTNTKFTKSAIAYAECAGVTLLGWSYPKKGNLADMIEESGIYPITVLTTLSGAEKKQLLNAQVALCSDIAKNPDMLSKVGIAKRKHEEIISESKLLCHA